MSDGHRLREQVSNVTDVVMDLLRFTAQCTDGPMELGMVRIHVGLDGRGLGAIVRGAMTYDKALLVDR